MSLKTITKRRLSRNLRAFLTGLCAAAVSLAAGGALANPQVDHVIVVSVDGLRGDALSSISSGSIPNLVEIASDASTLNARTAYTHTNTLPNHTCMITSRPVMGVDGHLYTGNDDPAANVTLHTNRGAYVVGMFDVAHDHGLRTAMFVGKTKFSLYDTTWNGAFNPVWGDINGAPDVTGADNGRDKIDNYLYSDNAATLAGAVVSELTTFAASRTLTFLHFHNPDSAGHSSGWNLTPGSPYVQSIMTVDSALGTVLSAIDGEPLLKGNTAIILTTDHGGSGTDHGDVNNPADYTIPFLVWLGDSFGSRDLYVINPDSRTDPGAGRPLDPPAPAQPVRNGDAGNLALDLLGLPPISGSTINAGQELDVLGALATCESLESGFSLGSTIGNHADWFDDGGGPVVAAGVGVGGSVGLQPANNIFTWTAHPFDWNAPEFAGVVVQLDVETDAAGVLDDDRVGWMIVDNNVDSDFIFSVQVDPGGGADDGAPSGTTRLEGYWDAEINVNVDRRPGIDILTGTLNPNTFYRLRAEFIRLTAASARIEASLIELDANGDPLPGPPVLSGVIADTSALGADAPDPAYFTGPIWPAFKNFTAAGANADNPCFEVLGLNPNKTVTSFQQGQGGYTGTVDTFLDSQNPGTSNATTTPLQVDFNPLRHTLLRFDNIFGNGPGQVPPAANIISASLTINVTNESVGVGAGLYRMLQPWNATDTWNTWGGGIQNNGVEAATTADVSGSSAVGLFVLDVTTSLTAWHASPATNYGWAWLPPAQDNSWQFHSAEGAIPPRLSVIYELVCEDSADCDDGNLCTVDTCFVGSCSNAPVECPLGQVCNPATGACGVSSTRTFQEGANGYSGTQDTTFLESAPGNVNGALDNWEWDDDDPNGAPVQRNFGLLRFDNIVGAGPGQIPPGSQVISATLTLVVFDTGATASVREVLVDWDEADSLTSACGAACDQGVDYSAVEIAQAPADPVGAYDIDVTASLQAWVDNPASNRGWFFLPPTGGPTSGGAQVRASEYLAVPADRPRLTVEIQLSCTDDGDCDDGNPCTTDTCGAEDTCEYTSNTGPCDDANLCTEDDVCAGGACAGTPVDCPQGMSCNPDSGECVAAPLIIAYNDLNASAGDANAANVTRHPYTAVNAALVDYPSGAVTSITMTGATVGGFDPHTGNGGQANAGTDAAIAFGPAGAVIVDLNNTIELDAANWDAIYTFNNLDPGRVYTLTTTANRNNPDYAGARFTRVTIEGADTFTNASSPGVVVHGTDSVSFSTGHNTVTGYVARWTDITAADGSFSIKSEWNNGLGSGAQNTKGYAMTAFKLEETALLCDGPSECDDGLFCTGAEDCVAGICVSSGNPCADPTPICSEANDACVTTCEETLLDNNFNGLAVGANPPNWVDTGANNSLVPNDALFNVKQVGADLVFGTDSTATNIHSHYLTPASADWSTFDFTGRMRISAATGAIGVTVLSDYTNSDTYYRLRRLGTGQTSFHLDQHPEGPTLLGDVDTGVAPAANTWMRFHIQVEVLPLQTNVRANVWADGGSEPVGWLADASDTSPTRLTAGAVGLWSFSAGSKYWDDLSVVFTAGDGAPCDDGDPCTTGDVCTDGGCAGAFTDCDGDGVCDADDNCPTLANASQTDSDEDGHGDVCDGPFDADHDGDVDLADHNALADCLAGPDAQPAPSELTPPACLDAFDADADGDVDLLDFANFVVAFTGHIATPCD